MWWTVWMRNGGARITFDWATAEAFAAQEDVADVAGPFKSWETAEADAAFGNRNQPWGGSTD